MNRDERLRREGAAAALRHCADVMEASDKSLGLDPNDPRSAVAEYKYLRARADQIEARREGIA